MKKPTIQTSSIATIQITGIGPVAVHTELSEIWLVGAITASGEPVNCQKKRVSRSKKNAAQAAKVEGIWLKEVKHGYFMLIEA